MPLEHNTGHRQNSESIAFRVPASLKAELGRLAARNHQSVGELMRDFARERIAAEHQRTFADEAHRQSREAAAAARNPDTDEHAVTRELDSDLDEFDREWN